MKRETYRLINEIQKLYNANYVVEVCDELQNELDVVIDGPQDSPYEGYKYKIKISIPDEYPYKSPSVGFVTRIYHPNIDELSGTICLDVLNQVWSPMFDLLNVVDIFIPQLLTYPNPKDPLNCQAASLYLNNYNEYIKKVEEHKMLHGIESSQKVKDEYFDKNLESSDSLDL